MASLSRSALLLGGFLAVLRVTATQGSANKITTLLESSPFGANPAAGAAGKPGAEPLEFRAALEEPGNTVFCIYETATHRSNWVDFNRPLNGVSIMMYDPARASVTVDYHGKILVLAIKRLAPAVNAPPLPGPGPAPVGGVMPVVGALPVGPAVPEPAPKHLLTPEERRQFLEQRRLKEQAQQADTRSR